MDSFFLRWVKRKSLYNNILLYYILLLLFMSETNRPDKDKKSRCKKGTRRNPKTGICEAVMKNKTQKIRGSPLVEEEADVAEEEADVAEEEEEEAPDVAEEEEPVVAEEEEEPDVAEEAEPAIEAAANKTRRCPKGTRMDKKTGLCNATKKNQKGKTGDIAQIVKKSRRKKKGTVIQELGETGPDEMGEPGEPEELEESDPQKNEFMKKMEKSEYDDSSTSEETYDFLYPSLNDPQFNVKIAQKKEFFNTRYDGEIVDIQKQSDIMCQAEFELLPHQQFVKNFLSFQTPYNSLLLYHSLGTGKTCSSIGIAEEMRTFMKQVGIKQRILVVASPNVQANFRLQLFDERKLKKIPNTQSSEDIWNIDSCIGNSLLKEINPTNIRGLSREKIISQINSIINQFYVFMGYGQLANYITEKTKIDDEVHYSDKEKNDYEIKKIKQYFNNRLIIIDEAHNIRLTDENNNNKKTAVLLMKVAKYSDNLRLLLLTATPMYNSYKEIVWITNLMNLNDKRSTLEVADVFDKDGNFKEGGPGGLEGGKQLLQRKLTGYVSYVRGENPYTFPYRIYPSRFDPSHTFEKNKYPVTQMNGKTIEQPIQYVNVFTNKTGEYQKKAYSIIIENLRKRSYHSFNIYGEMREMPSFDNMESFGYTLLQGPLESLNMVYPTAELDELMKNPSTQENPEIIKQEQNIISSFTGSQGIAQIMNWEDIRSPFPLRQNYDYKPAVLKKYGAIFSPEKIGEYSAKIANICHAIRNSTGIVIIYSQYIDGGILPLALALEEMGFSRYSSQSSFHKPLFKKKRREPIDARTMKPQKETVSSEFHPAQYIMITGDKSISPSNANDIKHATNPENRYGDQVRVILISKAGSEGLDFKNIRQIHILEPWYNMNRIEQIIGRGVRNLSHCNLPFEERNVEIYLHATLLSNEQEEAADLYIYRLAEKKALQIGKVTRLLKETAVDCILNIGQTNFTAEKLMAVAENQNIQIRISSGSTIPFRIGDNPFTDICDYMDTCHTTCSPNTELTESTLNPYTYNYDFVKTNQSILVEKIRNLFREHVSYKRNVLINSINIVKQYPIEQIYNALTYIIHNKNEFLYDKYGRVGNLINKGEYYLFQPIEITDEKASIYERTAPVDYKRESIQFELPKTKGEQEPTTAMDVPATEAEPDIMDKTEPLETLLQHFQTVFQEERVMIGSGEKNWYKHANHVWNHLQVMYKISQEDMERYVVEHNLDMFSLKDKLWLLQHMSSSTSENQRVLALVQAYFDKRTVEENGRKAMVLNKEESWKLFVWNPAMNTWEEGEPEDYTYFNMDRFKLDKSKINSIIGFVNMFKKRDMVFKIKDVSQSRNNIGARCGDSTTKSDVIKLLNQFLNKNVYDNSSDIYHYGFCVIIEVLMRHYTFIGKTNEKGQNIYFLTPEETTLHNIAKFSRA